LSNRPPAYKERQNPHYKENKEQNFGDAGGSSCDSAETEYRGDYGNNQKYERPVKHR
jgi:hypothetical protein